jgi:glycosyltransferase involved in cell wall biosynthesis
MTHPAAALSNVDAQPGVCQLLHGLNVGGAEVLAARLARQLRGEYRIHFVCLDALGTLGETLQEEGFPVWLLQRQPGFDWRCAWRLARLLKRERIDLVHAHQFTPYFYALATRLFRCRRPVLFTEHGRTFPDFPRRKRMLFNRSFLSRRDRVVAVGEAVRQALVCNEGLPEARIEVIYNGIDQRPFAGALRPRSETRRELGLGSEDFVIVQIARLDPLKDHATALRALRRLVEEQPRARLVIVGEGPERAAIEAEISRLGLGPYVRLTGLRHDIADLLAAADVGLLTSLSEGIPLTLIEAMAAGLPVVATAVGGVGEIVSHQETGLLAAARDDASLAAALRQLDGNRELCRDMGRQGRRRADLSFSEERMHDEYRRVYTEMLAAAPAHHGATSREIGAAR